MSLVLNTKVELGGADQFNNWIGQQKLTNPVNLYKESNQTSGIQVREHNADREITIPAGSSLSQITALIKTNGPGTYYVPAKEPGVYFSIEYTSQDKFYLDTVKPGDTTTNGAKYGYNEKGEIAKQTPGDSTVNGIVNAVENGTNRSDIAKLNSWKQLFKQYQDEGGKQSMEDFMLGHKAVRSYTDGTAEITTPPKNLDLFSIDRVRSNPNETIQSRLLARTQNGYSIELSVVQNKGDDPTNIDYHLMRRQLCLRSPEGFSVIITSDSKGRYTNQASYTCIDAEGNEIDLRKNSEMRQKVSEMMYEIYQGDSVTAISTNKLSKNEQLHALNSKDNLTSRHILDFATYSDLGYGRSNEAMMFSNIVAMCIPGAGNLDPSLPKNRVDNQNGASYVPGRFAGEEFNPTQYLTGMAVRESKLPGRYLASNNP